MDLSSFINKAHCECLNESDEHTLDGALTSQGGFLESDCDEQVNRTDIIVHCFHHACSSYVLRGYGPRCRTVCHLLYRTIASHFNHSGSDSAFTFCIAVNTEHSHCHCGSFCDSGAIHTYVILSLALCIG